MTGAAVGDSALGPAVVGPEQCRGGDPIPGVAAPMNSPEGIQACDECGLYDSDLDAAAALARHVPGGRVLYREASTGEVCEYAWPGTGAEVIASSTDPWIVDAYGRPVDWQERDLWTCGPEATCPTAAGDHRRPDPRREDTHAPMTSHSSGPCPGWPEPDRSGFCRAAPGQATITRLRRPFSRFHAPKSGRTRSGCLSSSGAQSDLVA